MMYRCFLGIVCVCAGIGLVAKAQPKHEARVVLHLKISSEIDVRTERHLRLALEEAEREEADIVILELDTYGGALAEADRMRQMLLAFERPVYVFINKNAASAGALISIACDSIYMSSGASIGAATVVTGAGEVAPDKYQSYMRGLMRSTAEAQGRNPLLAEAMVDADIDIDSLAPKGKVLTLSTKQALGQGFCEAEIASLDELLTYLSLEKATLVSYEQSMTERVIAFFLNPAISSVLILLIIWGIYAELQSPGLGLAGGIAVLAALLYLIPYYLNGLAAHWEILTLVAGIGLLIAEVFVLPGFGLLGLLGGAMVLGALVLIMLNNDGLDFFWVSSESIVESLTAVLFAMLGGGIMSFLLGSQLMRSRTFLRLTLPNNMSTEDGYRIQGGAPEGRSLLGKVGQSYSVLRPSGKVMIEGEVYEATVDTGQYLAEGTSIRVVSEEGRELRVTEVQTNEEQ